MTGHPAPPPPAYTPPPPPPPGNDTALGWTGLGLSVLLCIPLAPLAGTVVAVVALVRRRFRPRWVAVVSAAVGVLLTALQGLAVPSIVAGVRDGIEDAQEKASRDLVDHDELDKGDCVDDPDLRTLDGDGEMLTAEVERVPCGEPHDAEIFAVLRVPGEEFPGKAAIDRRTRECVLLFADFAGVRYSASPYDVFFYYPTRTTWQFGGDREIQCAVGDPDGRVTGTLAGSGRADAPQPGKVISIDRLLVGDCYDARREEDLPGVILRRCAGPHTGEVFAVVDVNARRFPGNDTLWERAQPKCERAFRRYVGTAYDDSRYTYEGWTPTRESWPLGDRVTVCALNEEDGRAMKGSAKGTRR